MIILYNFADSSTVPTYVYVIIVAVVIIVVLVVVILLLLKKLKFGFCTQYYFEKLLVQKFLYDVGCINSVKRNAFFLCLSVCLCVCPMSQILKPTYSKAVPTYRRSQHTFLPISTRPKRRGSLRSSLMISSLTCVM